MRRTVLMVPVTALALAGSPAMAQMPLGCFTRDYSAAHLAKNPGQHVERLQISIGPDPWGNDFIAAVVSGRLANQGRARAEGYGGHDFNQAAFCTEQGSKVTCQVECDGGSFTVRSLEHDQLEIETGYFSIDVKGVESEEGCGGLSDLAESGSSKTIYRLSRAPASACPAYE